MNGLINGVIVRITVRATISRKRILLLALPAIVLIGISALLTGTAARSTSWPPQILGTFGFTVLLPLTALILGTGVLGAEVEDGSIIHLLATPVSRSSIVLSKYLVAVSLTILLAAVPEYLAAAIATGLGSELSRGLLIGAIAAAFGYNALFMLFSAAFRPGRALAFGLVYIVLWEGLLSNLVPGVALLSIGHYGLAIANAFAHEPALHAYLSTGTGIGLDLVLAVAALALGTRQLSAFTIKGDIA
jgi:ABC-2 type transport system permease protein